MFKKEFYPIVPIHLNFVMYLFRLYPNSGTKRISGHSPKSLPALEMSLINLKLKFLWVKVSPFRGTSEASSVSYLIRFFHQGKRFGRLRKRVVLPKNRQVFAHVYIADKIMK